jgi:thioredoxin 1
MKNNLLVFVGLFALVLGGVWLYGSMRDDSSSVMEPIPTAAETLTDETGMASDTPQAEQTENAQMEKAGSYQPFSAEVLAQSAETRRVLFFYANWCPTCRPLDQALSTQSDRIPAGVTIIRVNYNDTETDKAEEDLAAKYGITYQHTFVEIDSEGNAIAKWNGGNLTDLVSKLK